MSDELKKRLLAIVGCESLEQAKYSHHGWWAILAAARIGAELEREECARISSTAQREAEKHGPSTGTVMAWTIACDIRARGGNP